MKVEFELVVVYLNNFLDLDYFIPWNSSSYSKDATKPFTELIKSLIVEHIKNIK